MVFSHGTDEEEETQTPLFFHLSIFSLMDVVFLGLDPVLDSLNQQGFVVRLFLVDLWFVENQIFIWWSLSVQVIVVILNDLCFCLNVLIVCIL